MRVDLFPVELILVLLVLALAAGCLSAAADAGKHDLVVFRKEGVYGCFPLFFIDPADGSWLASFGTRVRASHIDSTGGSAQYRSTDGGLTWQEATTRRQPALKLPSGRWLWADARGWERFPEDKAAELRSQGLTVLPVSPGVVAVARAAYVRWSDDRGATWQSKAAPLPHVSCLMGLHGGIVLRDGTVLVPLYGTMAPGEPDRAWVLRSTDGGETFHLVDLALDPAGKLGYNEAALVELPGNRVLAVVRTAKGDGCLAQCESTDGGKTWTPPRSTGLWGLPAHLLLLQDGNLLCTYGYRRPPFGVRAALSRDGGQTWQPAGGIALREDGGSLDLGYPMSLQAADGAIFTGYYFTDRAGVTHIAGSRYTPTWLAEQATSTAGQ